MKGGEKTMHEGMTEAGYANDPLADTPSSLAEKVESIEGAIRNLKRTANEIYGIDEKLNAPTEAAVKGSGIDALNRRLDVAIQQLYDLREPLEALKRKLIG